MEENSPVPALPPPSQQTVGGTESGKSSRGTIIVLAVVAVIIIALVIVAAVLLLRADNATTGRVRDVFIIFMAVESLVLGVAMIILIIQLATLINMLQNDLKPIVRSTSETVNTLKGTVAFLSENLAQPVITLNAYLAGIKQFLDLMRPGGRAKR